MTRYLFIDGAYLQAHYRRWMQTFYGTVPAIEWDVLASTLQSQRNYYYDAINYQVMPGEDETTKNRRIAKTQALHDHISRQTRFHVREGHVRRSPEKKKQEQKGVDVQLAVEALEHAARGNLQTVSLLSGDLDFEPLLISLARMGVLTKLIYVPQTAADELLAAADEREKLTLHHFWQFAAPSFKAAHGIVSLEYRQPHPDTTTYAVEREGVWNARRVVLLRPNTEAHLPYLYVETGDELTEPSYRLEYRDITKLPLAFELMFGQVAWT